MRTIRLIALTGAVALSAGLLVPATNAASAVPTATPAVATRVVQVDVDGDGARDEVTVEQSAADTFVVNVVTAAGEDDVVQFTSTINDDWGIEPWYGAAKLDKVKGYELLLLTWGGDGVGFRVLTWRTGAELVWEKAPKPRTDGAYGWYLVGLDDVRFGYRFSTTDGKRYVRHFELWASGSRWKGTIVKSVWKAGTWQKLSTKKVNLTKKQAKPYQGISGVTVIEQP